MPEDPRSDRPSSAASPDAGADVQRVTANGEAAARRSEQRFRAIFDSTYGFIGLTEPDGTLVEANRTALDFAGLRPQDVIGKKFWDCYWWQLSEETRAKLRAAVARAAAGDFVRYETDVLGAGGRVATIDFSIKPVRDEEGRVDFLLPEGRVITEAVQARRMQAGLVAAQMGTFEIDLATQAVHRSASADLIFGFPPDDAPRTLDAYLARLHPEDRGGALGAIRRAVEEGGEQLVSARLRLPDGRERRIDARGVVLPEGRGGAARLVGAIMDVTERQATEAARRRIDEQRHAALEAAGLGTWDYDFLEGVIHIDARSQEVFGYDRETIPVELVLSRVHPEDRPNVEEALAAAADPAGEGRFDAVYRLVRPDGQERWSRATGSVLFEGEGDARRAAHLVGVVADETARRAAERDQALLAAIVASSNDAVVSKTLDGVITSWNAGAERVFGYTAEEAVGQSVLMLIPPERSSEEEHILGQIRRGEHVGHYETVRMAKGGRRLDVSIAVSPLAAADGRVVGASKVARDITERKEAERALLAREEQLRVALSVVPLVLTHVDRDLRYTWVYNAHPDVAQREVLGRRLDELISPEEAEPLMALKRRVLETGESGQGEFAYHLGGELHTFTITAEPLRSEDGDVVGVMTASFDITDRVRAEEALRESEERFRLAASALSGMVYDWDIATDEVFRTEGLYDLIGVHPEDVPQERTWWADRVHPDDRHHVYGLIRTVLETDAENYAIEYRVRHEDGHWVHLWDRGHIVRDGGGRAVRVVGSSTDITARKHAEEALHESEARFRLAVSNDVLTLFEQDDALRYTWVYPQHPEFPEGNVGRTDAELVPGEGGERLMRLKRAVLETGAGVREEVEVPLPGGPRWYDLVVEPRLGGEGRVVGVAGVALDVTDRKRAETALRESEERFRTLADSAPALIWIADEKNHGTYFNRQWLEFTGRTMAQELGFGWAEAVHPDDRAEAAAFCQRRFDAREPFRMEFRLRRADGEYRWVLDHGIPRYTLDGRFLGYIGTCFDIHDRKQAEARALLLAETGRLVEQALDYGGTLQEIARVAVPGFADWCAIDLLHDDGSISAVEIAHGDPEKVRWGWELRAQQPIDPGAPTGVPHVIRTGEPEVYPVITDEMMVAGAKDEEELRLLREIGFSSLITVPMRAGNEVVGAITFVQTESGRHFDERDQEVAEEIGRRAGAAIETARLHQALQRSEERFRAISALTSDFAYAARVTEEGAVEREWVSGAYERITGYRPEEVGDEEPWRRLIHPEDVATGEAHVEALLSGRSSVCEHRLLTKSGGVRWVRDYARPELDEAGRVVRVIGAVQDTTEQKEAEQALRLSEERYRMLFTSIDEGFCLAEVIVDDEGRPVDYRFLEVNKRFEEQTGMVAPEGRTALELVPDLEPYWIETYARVALGGETIRFEQGSEAMGRWFNVYAAPVAPAGSRRFVLVFNDETARKRAEIALRESEERFRQLAEALPEIVYTNDAEGQTDYLNPRWFAYTGQPPETDPLIATSEALHPDDVVRVTEGWEAAFAAGETFEAELRLRRHDGQYRWFLTRLVPVRSADGAVARWFGTSTDIHAQKAAEAELAARVAERTWELERSNQELDQFAYVASHDLKGPLRGIDNLATWIAEDAEALLPESSKRHLDLLQGRVQRLEALLDSLLAYSRAGRLVGLAEPVDTAALVREVADLIGAPATVTFEIAGDLPTLETYRAPLELVFRNLLSNAVKHAETPDLHVKVSAAAADTPEGFVRFAVADDGPGIAPAYHDRIFGLFQTLRPRDEVEGSGMGLAVVKKTVESLGGSIRVDSSPGAGTTFYFTWPRAV